MKWRGEKRLHVIESALADQSFDLIKRVLPMRHIQSVLPSARRFVFSKEASRYMGEFIVTCGDLLLLNRQFAIPPYEVTYIEFNLDEMLLRMNELDPERRKLSTDNARDVDVGFLLERREGYVRLWDCSRGFDGHAGISPLCFDVGRPANEEHIFNTDGVREAWIRLALFLGTTIHDMPDEVSRSGILHHVYIHDYTNGGYRNDPELIKGMGGAVRNMWAALLLLNQPAHTRLSFQPPQPMMFKGKRRVYSAHNVVDIDLRGFKTIRKAMLKQMRESPRRHEVRGHFRHYNLGHNCLHEWSTIPDLNERFVCRHCGGWRVWMREMLRGDAAKGFVTKTYDVKAGQ